MLRHTPCWSDWLHGIRSVKLGLGWATFRNDYGNIAFLEFISSNILYSLSSTPGENR